MIYKVLPPCAELKKYISHFWVGTWDSKCPEANSIYYAVANSLTEIAFAFNSNKPGAELLFTAVQGQTDAPNQYAVKGFLHLLGVSIYSYAIPSLFNIAASDLNKEFLSLNTFLGNAGEELTEKIAFAATTEERITILTDFFKSLVNRPLVEDKLITKAIGEIKSDNGKTRIESLSNDFCLSQKQFNRRFRAFTGFNPKMYARITRFEALVKNYANMSSFTEAAYATGYYDQAHLNHEFKAFTGFSPKDFWRLGEEN